MSEKLDELVEGFIHDQGGDFCVVEEKVRELAEWFWNRRTDNDALLNEMTFEEAWKEWLDEEENDK